jgi:hypothetical protein
MKIFFVLTAAAVLLCAADGKYGKPLTLKEPMTLAALMSKADDYSGKTVQVKGKVTEVCEAMGCWLNLVNDEGQHLRFEAHDAGISFPKDVVGKTAIAEGKFTKTEMSREQAIAEAKEHAKDTGKPFDESKVKPGVEYSIEGTGAVIVSK